MNTIPTTQEVGLPLIVELPGMDQNNFVEFCKTNAQQIKDQMLKAGAIKFKHLNIDSVERFQSIVGDISSKFLNYIDGNSPRTKLTDAVYTSTEYDPSQRITMHNELSYSAKWPNVLFFSCLIPSPTGGETFLADSREIVRKMNKDIVEEIERKGIVYIRNLHNGKGMGPSWQDTFETTDKQQLESYCRKYNIDFVWNSSGSLKLKQQSKGIIRHPVTNERVWFNQVDQFHPSHLGEELFEALQALYPSPEEFPMFVQFGDGTSISEEMISEILKTIDEITVAPPWDKNELLIVDNVLVAHGRNSFTGKRKVIVAMAEQLSV